MEETGWGFAVDAELQHGLQAAIDAAAQHDTSGPHAPADTPARPDTISATGGTSLAARGPGFMIPTDLGEPPAPPQDSPAGTMTFVDPHAFAMMDLAAAGLPPGALLAPPDTLAGTVATVEPLPPVGAVTATLPDGTTLNFADVGSPPQSM